MHGNKVIQPGFVPAVGIKRKPRALRAGPPLSPTVQMVVWSHEQRTSPHHVVLDTSLLANARDGDVAELSYVDGKNKKFFFKVKSITTDMDRSLNNAQISVMSTLLNLLDIPVRSKVNVRLVSLKDGTILVLDMKLCKYTYVLSSFLTSVLMTR
jgi:hypothetical protein